MTEPEIVDVQVTDAEAGTRIDRFLGNRFYPTYSRSFLTGLIVSGAITVNGKPVRPAYRIVAGDAIRCALLPLADDTPGPEPALPLEVLHADDHIVVVNKPAGMIVHPGPGQKSGTLVNALLARYPELARVGVVFRPGIVHRLDGHTSGVMVVARTNHTRVHLVEQFKTKRVKKEYHAVVLGEMPFDSDYVDLPIGHDPKHHERMAIDAEHGKPSSTFYEVIERFPGATYVKCFPHTGRTHQIRVHLAHVGFPIVADPVYGLKHAHAFSNLRKSRAAKGLSVPEMPRHALHARKITFLHPVTEQSLTFEANVPDDMLRLLEFYRQLAKEESRR